MLSLTVLVGCRQDMHNQPKFYPQRGSIFFADGRSVRPQVEDTVAREQGEDAGYFLTGMVNGQEADGLPLPVTAQLLARGQERFNVYCTPCHSRTGYGHGIIVQRGYEAAANFHSERLRSAPLGHFFTVITNGYGAMPEYRAQIEPADRWAIAAYIRALQLSQNAPAADAGGAVLRPLDSVAAEGGYAPELAIMRFWTATAAARPVSTPPTPAAMDHATVPAVSAINAAAPSAVSAASFAKGAARTGTASAAAGQDSPLRGTVQTAVDDDSSAVAAGPAKMHGDAARGKQVYLDNCSVCHQETLQGRAPKIPAILGAVTRLGEPHVRDNILNGRPEARPMMPAFGEKLTSAQVDDLVAFLKTGRTAE